MPTPPMTLLVARRVEPAHYTAFIEWMHEGERLAADFPGYLGSGMLAPPPGAQVLDVGSGPGKFCIVGALSSQGQFFGIDQSDKMVEVARQTADLLGAKAARFAVGNVFDFDWRPFPHVYLYNPFEEELFHRPRPATGLHLVPPSRYGEYVERAIEKLGELPIGAKVALYHGFGGEMPDAFTLLHRQPAGDDELCLWMHRRRVTQLSAHRDASP